MKIKDKNFYTIEDIEKYLSENYIVEKYRKLADAYPEDKSLWKADYDDVLDYTDGIINADDYYLFVTKKSEELDESNGYNEIFLQCNKFKNIPDRMFILDSWGKSGIQVSKMVDANIDYIINLEKNKNKKNSIKEPEE